MRIGIDLGGSKIEALAMDADGQVLTRHRISTPRGQYDGTLEAIASLVERLETETGERGTVGIGIPGTVSCRTGLIKNANSTWLNGRTLREDLSARLDREVRLANDANCLAVSEAVDGAAAGFRIVFGVILGTGCGGGLAVDARVHPGPNGIAGEWGHNPLPWASGTELRGPLCYCGKRGCMEVWTSGPAVEREFHASTGRILSMREIAASADPEAIAAIDVWLDRLARGLASTVHVLDPEVLVFGGGLSQVQRLYAELPRRLRGYCFGSEFETPIVQAQHGDSSGVRGAAWLWGQ